MQKKLKYSEAEHYLEGLGEFNTDYLPQSLRFIPPDGAYVYERKGFFRKAASAAARTVTFVFGGAFSRLFFGTRVKGRENLKGIKGAICISNHVHWLDTLFVKQAVGHYRSYHTAAPWNNRKGAGGRNHASGGPRAFRVGIHRDEKLQRLSEKNNLQRRDCQFLSRSLAVAEIRAAAAFQERRFQVRCGVRRPSRPAVYYVRTGKTLRKKKVTVNILPPVYSGRKNGLSFPCGECA